MKKRILFATSKFFPEYSGPANRINNLIRYMHEHKSPYILHILCDTKLDSRKSESSKISHEISIHRLYPPFFLICFKPIIIILSFIRAFYIALRLRPALVHILGQSPCCMGTCFYANVFNVPIIYELVNHNSLPVFYLDIPIIKHFQFVINQGNSLVIAISNDLREKAMSLYQKKSLRPPLIWERPNPVNIQIFSAYEFSLTLEEDFKLLYISKFKPRKNQLFLLDVIEHLPDGFSLTLAGPVDLNDNESRSYFNKVSRAIDTKKLSKRVKLVSGFVKSADLLRNSHIYLIPSYNEGLGTTFIEALVSPKFVIANQQEPAFRQYLMACKYGFCRPLDPKLWANLIVKLPNSAHLLSNADSHKYRQKLVRMVNSDVIHGKYVKYYQLLTK